MAEARPRRYAARPTPARGDSARLVALDAVAAAGYLGFAAPLAVRGGSLPVAASLALAATLAVPVAVRRRWPVPVLGIVLAASVAGLLTGTLHDPMLAAAFALYPVALAVPRPRRLPTAAVGAASLLGLLLVAVGGAGTTGQQAPDRRLGLAVLGAVLLGGTWTVARAVRDRRDYADRWATQLAERAVAEERLHIARELHDVVAHAMGVIAVKAGVANHVVRERPAEASEALRVIESTSRDALVEMRALLGVLRTDDTARRSPAPGLGGLAELADRAALVGVPVELTVRGADRVPDGVGLSVYRIVQEAVTNVVKHAAPARCRVLVESADHRVRVEVSDDGPGVRALPTAGGGHGLVGMRERVAAYGGTFHAGPRPAGGFAVRAELPYGGRP